MGRFHKKTICNTSIKIKNEFLKTKIQLKVEIQKILCYTMEEGG